MLFQTEPGEHRGGCSKRIECAEQIVMKPRDCDLFRPDRSSGNELGFEDQNIPARIGQSIGGHHPIGTSTNHDGVGDHGLTWRTKVSNRRKASLFLT